LTDLTPEAAQPEAAAEIAEDCPRCAKPPALCVCQDIVPIDNKIAVLILQHPQEQDKALGTARLTALHFKKAVFKTGLSWPSLSKALGKTADPRKWATLYLGSADPVLLAPGRELVALDAKGKLLPMQDTALAGIEGVIVLDGTWSQAKTLWWRNAWLLKCRRVVLGPKLPSLYGKLRREPRREALSTLEAVGLLLSRLEKKPEIELALTRTFRTLLQRYRDQPSDPLTPPPPRGRPRARTRSTTRGA